MVRQCQAVLVDSCMSGLARGRGRAVAIKVVGWRCSGYIPYESDAALTALVMS